MTKSQSLTNAHTSVRSFVHSYRHNLPFYNTQYFGFNKVRNLTKSKMMTKTNYTVSQSLSTVYTHMTKEICIYFFFCFVECYTHTLRYDEDSQELKYMYTIWRYREVYINSKIITLKMDQER